MTETLLTADELAEMVFTDPDPYPDLPLMRAGELRDGDVLMMLGTGWTQIGKIPVPASWLIRYLDGGAYSHSAVVSLIDNIPFVWGHDETWKLHPVELDKSLHGHAWCHVYRLLKHGDRVGSDRYPSAPLVQALEARTGDPYDMNRLVMSGIITVISNMPSNPLKRDLLRRALVLLVKVLNELWEQKKFDEKMLVCTAVAGLSYWNAKNQMPHDYAIEVDLERRRKKITATNASDEKWEQMIADMRAVLNKIFGDFDKQLNNYMTMLSASNADWVDVGSAALPATLVSPSDLEFSRVLQRVGHLAVPV